MSYLAPIYSWLIPTTAPNNDDNNKSESSSPWTEFQHNDGRIYYWNQQTNETSWTLPIEYEKTTKQTNEPSWSLFGGYSNVNNNNDDKHIQVIKDGKPVDTRNVATINDVATSNDVISIDVVKDVTSTADIEAEEPDPDIAKYPTGTAYDLDAGLSHNVAAQVETPKSFLERVLVDDEVVVDTFDVKFPGEFVPLWKIITLLIFTCGLYSLVLLFRSIRRYCYKMRWCTPNTVHFTFGKMAVTSKGRVICWKEEVFQFKPPQKSYKGHFYCLYLDYVVYLVLWSIAKLCIIACCPNLCAPPIEFATTNLLRSYRLADIKQITQFMTNEAMAIWCCLEYH